VPDRPVVSAGSPKMDPSPTLQETHFVPRILRDAEAVTPRITPSALPEAGVRKRRAQT